jgi:hypothetical protein
MDILHAHRYDFIIAIPNFGMDFLALGASCQGYQGGK